MRPGALLILLLSLAGACGGADRPSVLLVTVDTLRADALGASGNPRARTPRMDRLAAEGVRFARAKANCPLTLPSHVTILTGLLPPEHGLRDNDPLHPLPPPELRSFPTLAETLGREGYDTAAFVSASVLAARTGLDQGFKVYDGPEEGEPGQLRYAERRGGDTVERAAAWLETAGEPFFLWVHLFDPHDPYAAPVAFRSAGTSPGSREAYEDEVAYADHCVGRLLDALAGRPDAERTLTVLTSDHGEGLGDHGEPTHGYLLYDATLGVPLVLRWPGHLPGEVERNDLVSLVDLFDAVLSATGSTSAPGETILDGPEDRIALAETLYGWRHMGWAQLLAAQQGTRKLIRGVGDEVFDLAANPKERRPLGEEAPPPAALLSALASYRGLAPRIGDTPQSGEPLPGLPYLAGTGRHRTRLLDPETNRRLRAPDPGLARELDGAKARIGRDDPAAVKQALLGLADRDPGNPTIRFWLGRNAKAAGDRADVRSEAARHRYAEAAEHFADAYARGLAEARVLNLWLQSLLLAGDLEKAGRVVEQEAREVAPDCGTHLMMGAYFQSMGDLGEAARMADLAGRLARTPTERAQLSRFRHNLASGNEK